MKNLIIIGLLALCAEDAALDYHYDRNGDVNKMGYSHKQIARVTALIERSKEDALTRKDGAAVVPRYSSSTKYQQIASLWHIEPGEVGKPIRLFGKGN